MNKKHLDTDIPAGYVDLGLSSGTLWAEYNVGASSEWDYGYYFTFKEAKKMNAPKIGEFEELINECKWTWITGKGYKLTGSNGKTLNLPAAGWCYLNDTLGGEGGCGSYWTSRKIDFDESFYLFFDKMKYYIDNTDGVDRHSVRLCYRNGRDGLNFTNSSSDFKVRLFNFKKRFAISLLIMLFTILIMAAIFDSQSKNHGNGEDQIPTLQYHGKWDYVDLGLTSGTKWATCNLGATTTWSHGDYYDWDSTKDFRSKMPSKLQLEELLDECTWKKIEGKGYKVTGPNGNSICLPAAGWKDSDNKLYYQGSYTYYWSSTRGDSNNAFGLYYYDGYRGVYWNNKNYKLSVRLISQ